GARAAAAIPHRRHQRRAFAVSDSSSARRAARASYAARIRAPEPRLPQGASTAASATAATATRVEMNGASMRRVGPSLIVLLSIAEVVHAQPGPRAPAGPPAIQGPRPGAPPRDRPAVATGTAVIRGRIFAADTGRPLRRARITATAPELAGEQRSTSTAMDGRYELAELP